MAKICSQCNRRKEFETEDPLTGKVTRHKASKHRCDIAIVRDLAKSAKNPLAPYDVTVHSDRIEKGGDLYKKVTGKKPTHEVMFRSRLKVEKLAERKGRKRTRKAKDKKEVVK